MLPFGTPPVVAAAAVVEYGVVVVVAAVVVVSNVRLGICGLGIFPTSVATCLNHTGM